MADHALIADNLEMVKMRSEIGGFWRPVSGVGQGWLPVAGFASFVERRATIGAPGRLVLRGDDR